MNKRMMSGGFTFKSSLRQAQGTALEHDKGFSDRLSATQALQTTSFPEPRRREQDEDRITADAPAHWKVRMGAGTRIERMHADKGERMIEDKGAGMKTIQQAGQKKQRGQSLVENTSSLRRFDKLSAPQAQGTSLFRSGAIVVGEPVEPTVPRLPRSSVFLRCATRRTLSSW